MSIENNTEPKIEVLDEVLKELLELSKKQKNMTKRDGAQDAYALVVGFRNNLKNNKSLKCE
tara:strand:+ start:18775 stop:18957 length:183 start_codon:yes stop_codon:yes gene_type:complete